MFTESEWMFERQKLFNLMEAHPDWSLRGYAREVQHDLGWVRKWKQRFRTWTSPSVDMFRGQSRRPKHSPKQLAEQVKDQWCALRESLSERFHRAAGAQTIQHFLKQAGSVVPSGSSIYKAVHERGYIPLRPKAEHVPLVLPEPMDEWEMDFGEIYLGEVEGSLEFFLVVDRGTSRVVYLEGCGGYRATSALEAAMCLFTKCGLPKRLRFDRDPRLWGSWTRDGYPSPLVQLLCALGVERVICPPHRPDKKPFVERCIRTLKEEWLARQSPTTLADALALLDPFLDYYNAQRPHQGRACQDHTPDEAFPSLPVLPTLPQMVAPNRWLDSEQGRAYRRRINARGTIQLDKHVYYIGQVYAGAAVLARLDGHARCLWVTRDGHLLKKVPLKGLYPDSLHVDDYVELLKAEASFIEQYRHFHWEQRGDPL